MNTMHIDDLIKDCFRLLLASKAEKRSKQKKRFDAVLLYMEGYPRKQIADILHIPHRTVSYYIARYNKEGFDALFLIRQPGAPKKLSDEQEKEPVSTVCNRTPEEAGVGIFANWTAPLACAFVKKEFGVSFSNRGMQDLFARLGLRYTRPTYTLNKADPEKQSFSGISKKILSLYLGKKVIMIPDNARIHHANLLKDFLKKNRKYLEPVYLPPYSPNLNKIEELWGWLKDSVIYNIFFHSREEIRKAVQKFITWVNTVPQMVIDRLCV